MNVLLQNEAAFRLGGFALAGLLLVFLQWRFALRGDGRWSRRQLTNLALVAIDSAVLRLLFPVLAVGLAASVHATGGGLLGRVRWPAGLEFAAALVVLDLAIYWQHRLFHVIPLFWRMHRVHHADRAFDVTTGVRFHPLEIAASMLIKFGVVAVLGPHPAAVLVFEIVLNLGSLWTHTDIALPNGIDRRLRWLIVTPSMHRIHHSTRRRETDSNYGFHLSVWDRLFGSYTTAPQEPEKTMKIGLDKFPEDRDQTLIALLVNPFVTRPRRKAKTP
ncbi:MAG: sterol desaturase family protein [Wenzhouxiangellaceae bacterium]|nr:sterol desaturase family protein [Wenzhouxiangellaceae bacterium]